MATTANGPPLPCLISCSTPSASVEGAACGLLTSCEPESQKQRRWFSVLAELQTSTDTSTAPEDGLEAVARLLREALLCVQGDEQWNCSGIAQMLQRALEMSERGCVQSARKAAVGLLDFHKMVEKYRQVVASRTKSSSSGHSTGSGKRQNSEELESDMSEDASGPLKRQRTGCLDEVSADTDMATASHDPRGAEFAVPHLPAKKASSAAAPHTSSPRAAASPVAASTTRSTSTTTHAPAAPASVVWTGCVRQAVSPGARDLVYCRISVPLPAECASELAECTNGKCGVDGDASGGLEVAQLAPRRGVKLGRHRVCKCTLLDPTPAQLTKLKSMAQNELVALAPLESHGLILVPYLDNSGGVRMVCFCLTLS